MIILKDDSVSLEGLKPAMIIALPDIHVYFKAHNSATVITSGTEKTAKHMEGSKHYGGGALDFRTWYLKDKPTFARGLQGELGSDYDVILEKDHLHVEHDPESDDDGENKKI